MITPIKELTIQQICERKEDLLVSADDIKKVARNERNRTIDAFMDEITKYYEKYRVEPNYHWLKEVAEQLKGEKND